MVSVMTNRLTKIYTKTGDQGSTALADGTRIAKDELIIAALGDVDELNAAMGIIVANTELPDQLKPLFFQVQNELFELGGELSLPKYQGITESAVLRLEQQIDQWNQQLHPLKEFILPGGHPIAADCHLARTICRRAERTLVKLNQQSTLNSAMMQYINRLSDWLFVVARFINQNKQVAETYWQR